MEELNTKTTFIYCLIDPRNNQIRYIGKSNTPHERWINHKNGNKKDHKSCWIKSLKNKGLLPILEIIEEVPVQEWRFWETFYICLYRGWGFNLTNHKSGGEGIESLSQEARNKISNTLKGRPVSEERKIRRSNTLKGKPKSRQAIINSTLAHSKTVYQYDLDGNLLNTWWSVNEAQRQTKESCISQKARGLKKSLKYRWSYEKI